MCASCSLFIRGLLCTLLVACPAMAESVTGLDDIKLAADRTLRLVVRPEPRCVLGDLDAIALETKRMAQERADPAATNILLTIEPLARRCSKTTASTSIIRPVKPTNDPVPGPSKTRFTSFATSSCTTISSTSLPNP